MLTGKPRVPNDRLMMNFCQATGLSHAIAFGDVFVNGNDGFVGESGIEKDGSATFGEGFFAMGAIQQAGIFLTVSEAYADIFCASHAVFRTLFIRTEKVLQVVHDYSCKKIPENTSVWQGENKIQDTKENVNAGRPQGHGGAGAVGGEVIDV
jgi:hypothetical protein